MLPIACMFVMYVVLKNYTRHAEYLYTVAYVAGLGSHVATNMSLQDL